jgi:hypothetical protein
MLTLKKVTPYNLRKLVSMTILAFSPIMSSCDKNDDAEVEQHDTVYTFSADDFSNIVPVDKIKASADSVQVRKIYMVPVGKEDQWMVLTARNINALTENVFKKAKEVSPSKVEGRGNIELKPGVINPADSVSLVEIGFTVNQR